MKYFTVTLAGLLLLLPSSAQKTNESLKASAKPKEVISKLKKIEKLSKQLRTELAP